jgi:hypothetical protein
VSLRVLPVTLAAANDFVRRYHRHHGPRVGHMFSVAVGDAGGTVRGVAIVGRPVARALQDGRTIEVLRVCTDGARNACSKLYATARRASAEMGYTRGLTYILDSENGHSLKASGFVWLWTTRGGLWDTPARRREQTGPSCSKQAWGWGDFSDVDAWRRRA